MLRVKSKFELKKREEEVKKMGKESGEEMPRGLI